VRTEAWTEICLLGFLNEAWCQRLVGELLPLAGTSRINPKVIGAVKEGCWRTMRRNPKASARSSEPLCCRRSAASRCGGEITEKGYILNQGRR